MGWSEVIDDVEKKVTETIDGSFTPLDNVPFFTVCYPPDEERNAIREFRLLSERFKAKDISSEVISMKDIFKAALIELGIECDDEEWLIEFEGNKTKSELKEELSRYLPEIVSNILYSNLKGKGKRFVAVLIRTGALYPFVRTSSIRSKLENKIKCILVIAYPANNIGEMLEDPSFNLGGYYRGEIVPWR